MTYQEDQLEYVPIDDTEVTSDLGYAAALESLGIELISVDKTNPRRAVFIFRKEPGIEEVAKNFFAKKLQVNASDYFDAIRFLKQRLYNGRESDYRSIQSKGGD